MGVDARQALPAVAETPEFWDARAALPAEHEANGWRSEESAATRYAAAVVHLNRGHDGPELLLDFGCGTGALADWLPPGIVYCGWERNPAMRARAHAAGRPVIAEAQGQLLAPDGVDHLVMLGTFNLRPYSSAAVRILVDEWWPRVRRTLILSVKRHRRASAAACDREHVRWDPLALAALANLHTHDWLLDCSYNRGDAMLVLNRG